MDREVKWTEFATTDLEEIAEYIAKDSEYYATSHVPLV
jgi:plasmid stabilization system protein ParE